MKKKVPRLKTDKQAEAFLAKTCPDLIFRTAAARLKSTRRISYADGFAAALAKRERASLFTGDPELRAMADVVTVEWLA